MRRFRPIDRKTARLLPSSVEDWLLEDHLARFIVEAMEQLDLSDLARAYAGRGGVAYPPEVMPGLLVYGYASGLFSSRKIARATCDSVVGHHPDHDTLATFRRRFLDELVGVFVQVLELARGWPLVRTGKLCEVGRMNNYAAPSQNSLYKQ